MHAQPAGRHRQPEMSWCMHSWWVNRLKANFSKACNKALKLPLRVASPHKCRGQCIGCKTTPTSTHRVYLDVHATTPTSTHRVYLDVHATTPTSTHRVYLDVHATSPTSTHRVYLNVHATSPTSTHRVYLDVHATSPTSTHRVYLNVHATSPTSTHRVYLDVHATSPTSTHRVYLNVHATSPTRTHRVYLDVHATTPTRTCGRGWLVAIVTPGDTVLTLLRVLLEDTVLKGDEDGSIHRVHLSSECDTRKVTGTAYLEPFMW